MTGKTDNSGKIAPAVKKIRSRWLSSSLQKKVRVISWTVAAAVFLSILANLSMAGFGMTEFGRILDGNSQSLNFWGAVEAESRSFALYVGDRTQENQKVFDTACSNTLASLQKLPFNYNKIGEKRYAGTWTILNSYRAYEIERSRFLQMEPEEEGYLLKLYEIYRRQEYIKSYAGRLEQITVQDGHLQYRRWKPLFFWIPAVTLLFGAAAMGTVLWMNRSMENGFIRPVAELARDSRRIADNEFTGVLTETEGDDEVAELVCAFQIMKKATEGYILTLKEKHEVEKQLDAVRLQMLKNQINPHFLFNTLNMISCTAQAEGAETTEKMIESMSSLFRYNLKSTDSVMPLAREVKIVQDYIYLQKMRFGSRVHCRIDCAEETLEEMVPSFALQPLVENAIVHGLCTIPEGGCIYIRSWSASGRLCISVADTGRGIAAVRLYEIRKALENGEEKKTGVGIGNIYKRVHAMYRDGELYVDSREGRGTVVQLRFTSNQTE